MDALEIKRFEQNEVGWWSNWADAVWPTADAYAIFSKRFDEWFFNRAGFLGLGHDLEAALIGVEREFDSRGLPRYILAQDTPGWEKLGLLLKDRGYAATDTMAVMEMRRGSFTPNPGVDVRLEGPGGVEEWARAYLHSFYGDAALLGEVREVMEKAAKLGAVGLLLARVGGDVAGCAALFRTDGLLGAYCIGTVPRFRLKHVASTMLMEMERIANQEKRKLVLQTMVSDSVEAFYLKNGFERRYGKVLFWRRSPGE